MKPFCLAVDWSTSSLQIWLMSSLGNPMIIRESDEGAEKIGERGFRDVLDYYLENLSVEPDVPVIICGMAGAKTGWRDAGFITLPLEINSIARHAVSVPHKNRDIRILPGIAEHNMLEPDIMRGEETRLLGVEEYLPQNALICIPGRHSKWALQRNGSIVSFSTFMTGELSDLVMEHSMVGKGVDRQPSVDPASPTFLRAVGAAYNRPQEFTHHLFSQHASNILGYASRETNQASIFGTMLGLELAGANAKFGPLDEVVLIADDMLAPLYSSSLNSLRSAVTLYDADMAVRNGLNLAARTIWD